MGMFDRIVVRMRLPGIEGDASEMEFQTKSLDCELAEYELLVNGTLVKRKWIDSEEGDNSKLSAPEFIPLDGEVYFYGDCKKSGWCEHKFLAHFEAGIVRRIGRLRDDSACDWSDAEIDKEQ